VGCAQMSINDLSQFGVQVVLIAADGARITLQSA
jgi:hypothetical protein